ncbi:MAG TPA: hypothetical protein VML55_23100 [Planctomycetaceae bacterium]|nr:hypothetical protein [Planctomycetaceae bacterium]
MTRALTDEEKSRYRRLRGEIESERDEIIARGRQYKAEYDALRERDRKGDHDPSV